MTKSKIATARRSERGNFVAAAPAVASTNGGVLAASAHLGGLSAIPLDRDAVAVALEAIPAEREQEMTAEISEAAQGGDAARLRKIVARWVMIGSHYADPDREANHPLAAVLGMFENEPLLDRLTGAIARQRAEERDAALSAETVE